MNYFRGTMSNRKKDIFLLSIAMPIYVTILLNSNVFIQRQLHPRIKVFCFEEVDINFALFELFLCFMTFFIPIVGSAEECQEETCKRSPPLSGI